MRSRLESQQKAQEEKCLGKLDKRDDKFAGMTESSRSAANPIIGYLIVHTNKGGGEKKYRCNTRKQADEKFDELWKGLQRKEGVDFYYVYADKQTWKAKERTKT